MTGKYDDILHLRYPVSTKRPRMKSSDRAAQFSPFAALTGHNAAIYETARLTKKKHVLDENAKDELSYKLQIIADRIKERPEIEIVYFLPDAKKAGGAYVTAIGAIKKIDEYERTIIMTDGAILPIDDIFSIEGQIFEALALYAYEE